MTNTRESDRPRILVIDDEESICRAFRRFFEARGWAVDVAATGGSGIEQARATEPDLVFLDVRLPDGDGLQIMERLRDFRPETPVIIVTAYGGMHTVLQAVRGGAFDYLPKPIDLDRALELAERAVESRAAGRPEPAPSETESTEGAIVGSSKAMQEVFKRVAQVAQSDGTVLILGRTGTGKELIARAIHRHGPRRDGPFVAVNCAALPGELVESELFGCVRGAFTGANADRPGRFEAADGGTLLLDEVGELPPPSQTKLLRVLDSQVVERVGSVEPIPLDVRVIAATNRDLTDDVEGGTFRPDLYYRLSALQIELPPLADRKEDILSLARHFLRASRPADAPVPVLAPEAAKALLAYSWPGNVRELKNAMEHAVTVAPSPTIRPGDLPPAVTSAVPEPDHVADQLVETVARYVSNYVPEGEWYPRAVAAVEKMVIERALRECRGNQSQAAELLGLHRNTLRAKIRELDIDVG
ncbi:MAG: sigma-54-dependent transcriptional regulator [Planctomycetota bacterium]